MSGDHDSVNDNQGSSRRALLKGAVAVGVGAAVYTAPVVGTVPAYATHGLKSWRTTSGDLCMYFSPNQVSQGGRWYSSSPASNSGTTGNGNNDAFLSQAYTVGASARTVTVTDTPNNENAGVAGTTSLNGNDGSSTSTAFCECNDGNANEGLGCVGCADPYEFYGGGVAIRLLDPTCEFVVQKLVCNFTATCLADNVNAPPATWAKGSSLSPIDNRVGPNGHVGGGRFQGDATRAVYYHTGRTGFNGTNRCKLQITFRIRCR